MAEVYIWSLCDLPAETRLNLLHTWVIALIEIIFIMQLLAQIVLFSTSTASSFSSYVLTCMCLLLRWELVGSVSHCRAGAGVAVCSSHVSQIRDVGQGSSNVANCMWPPAQPRLFPGDWLPGLAVRPDHCTSTQTMTELWVSYFGSRQLLSPLYERRLEAVQFAHSDWGIVGRFYWLDVHIWQMRSSLTKWHVLLDSCWCYLQSVM